METACPCVRGRLGERSHRCQEKTGLPVRTGTVGPARHGRAEAWGLARAYGDGWGGLPVRTGTVGVPPCDRIIHELITP